MPSKCPEIVYAMMDDCWKIDPGERPRFSQLKLRLDTFREETTPDQEHNQQQPDPWWFRVQSFSSQISDSIDRHVG